jgi:class 3 adenylate cyclase/tetratricopeptide (TPR) repeat protein
LAESLQEQMEKLRHSINGLELQRGILGDAIVDPALTALREQLSALEKQVEQEEQAAVPVEERRMVTILFIDMVGSTSMAEKLDPEEWRQVIAKFHTTLGEAIITHHGAIAQYLGDGLLAFFGAREASEHDPENAIRAALNGQAAVANQLSAEKVLLRAGIHTGLVVVGELGIDTHKEFTASGDAMNLAARLQSAAPPGGILISHDTYRYVRGVFDLTPRPPLTVKGKSEPLQTYLVRRAKPRPFRSVTRGVAGVEIRTIGREAEIQALENAYLRAYEGHGTVWAQLVGDPGVGKSRLLADMSDWMDLREETFRLLRARAFPDDLNQAFALVRRMWFDRFQIADDAPLEQAEAKWVERFKEFSGQDDCEEAAHALGLLVGLPFSTSPHIGAMRNDPTQVKGRALVVSRELVQAIRQQSPLVVLLEDLQWTDAASSEYLMEVFLGEATGGYPNDRSNGSLNGTFILGTARPEWRPPEELAELFESSISTKDSCDKWSLLISLATLSDEATRDLARELLQQVEDIPEQIIDLVVERAEGVPYYAEEMVNWFIDHGILDILGEQWRYLPERLKEQPLPATLQHLLLTRLSALSPPERAAMQRGAIFGRRFWTGGVEALGVPTGAEILGHLQPRGFVEAQPESAFQGDTEWSFHQNLLQEVTYESVLKRERAALHKLAAGWLEDQARQAGRLDEFAGLLGDHCERAGELSSAADWYLRAGRRAFSQGAPREAADFYTGALELLPPVDRQRRWQALLGREEAHGVLGDAEPWKADIAAILELAQSFDDDNYLAEANLRQALFAMRTGDESLSGQASQEAFTAARRCGIESIETKALSLFAVVDVNRGNRLTSLEYIEKALELAHRLGDESVLAFVFFRAAYCYFTLGDIARSISLQFEQIELDHRRGNRSQEAMGLGNLGDAYIWMGLYKQGRSQTEQARTINEALDARRNLAYNLANLGNIYLATSDLRKARQLMEQALHEISPSGDTRGKVYTLINLGCVLLAMGDATGAARRLIEARELALKHNMAALACEATTGLAASAVMQGQLDEARNYAGEAWNYLKEQGWLGMDIPIRAYRSLTETFDSLGEAEISQAVVESGHQALIEVAATINVPEWRQSLLENVPDHRTIMEMWERMKL